MADPIRLLIADGQRAQRGLRGLIERQTDMEVVDALGDGARVAARVADLEPDVLLLDLTLAGAGLRLLEKLRRAGSRTRAVILAPHADVSLLRSALAVAALGYVVHRDAEDEILVVVRRLHAGSPYHEIPSGGVPVGLDPRSRARRRLEARYRQLSGREREVLEAVAFGFTSREIAAHLGISIKSIETYRHRVAEKLGFRNRAELVRFALEVGLLDTGRSGLPDHT